MPKDYPDWGALPQRPNWGTAKRASDSVTVAGTTTDTILTLSLKGLIYSGSVYILNEVDHQQDEVSIYIDGNEFFRRDFVNMRDWNETLKFGLPLTLILYDTLIGNFKVILQQGIGFDTSFELKYHNNRDDSALVQYNVYYAEVI